MGSYHQQRQSQSLSNLSQVDAKTETSGQSSSQQSNNNVPAANPKSIYDNINSDLKMSLTEIYTGTFKLTLNQLFNVIKGNNDLCRNFKENNGDLGNFNQYCLCCLTLQIIIGLCLTLRFPTLFRDR